MVPDTDNYFGTVGDVSGVSVGMEAGLSLFLTELDFPVKNLPVENTDMASPGWG